MFASLVFFKNWIRCLVSLAQGSYRRNFFFYPFKPGKKQWHAKALHHRNWWVVHKIVVWFLAEVFLLVNPHNKLGWALVRSEHVIVASCLYLSYFVLRLGGLWQNNWVGIFFWDESDFWMKWTCLFRVRVFTEETDDMTRPMSW